MADKELLPLLSPRSLPKSSRRRDWGIMSILWTFLVTIVVALLPVKYALANPLPERSLPRSSSQSHLEGHLGAVASESSICSQIGIDLLKEGGNAADAVRLGHRYLPQLVLTR